MRKVCVITGTRAEYGLLQGVMQGIMDDSSLELQIIATGMHLSPEFGLTYKLIERDGLFINRKIEMLTSSDTPVGIAKSMGLGLIAFADAFYELKPDIIVVLGDRFEILSAVSAALVARIPVAHIHGGEATECLIDESIRHSITKMSQLHFVAAEEYRQRVIQLGEQPGRVFLVGGLGVDAIKRINLLSKNELEESMNIKFGLRNLLITFHPVTLEPSTAKKQFAELLDALSRITDTQLIFTLPNADTDGRALINMVENFAFKNPNAHLYNSLGQVRYLSCMAHVDGVVGNSSSGLLEAPSLKIGTINIGERQRGRLQATSIINCDPTCDSISDALEYLYSTNFQNILKDSINPYGYGGASKKIVSTLRQINLDGITMKRFYNLNS